MASTEWDENELVCVGAAELIGETAKSWHVRLVDHDHTSWFPRSRCAWATEGCFHVPRWLLDRKDIQLDAREPVQVAEPTPTSKPPTKTRKEAALARAKALGWRVLDGGRAREKRRA